MAGIDSRHWQPWQQSSLSWCWRHVMKSIGFVFSALFVVFLLSIPNAQAGRVLAKIDLSSQRMKVYVNGAYYGTWRVSTARRGYRTPIGTFRPQRMHRRWYSRKYYNSPMPHSVFFYKGYAIHGTNAVRRLGRRASHGCVRLHPRHAATLFRLIKRNGSRNTRIVVQR